MKKLIHLYTLLVSVTLLSACGGGSNTSTDPVVDVPVDVDSGATLSALIVSVGTLSPAFDSGTLDYDLFVFNEDSSISVAPTTSDPDATVSVQEVVLDSGATSEPIDLVVGEVTTVSIIVTSPNGEDSETYTLNVTRSSDDSRLSGLAVSLPVGVVGSDQPYIFDSLALTYRSSFVISPAFDTETTSYSVTVFADTRNIVITPTASSRDAVITVAGQTVSSGSASAPITLSAGASDTVDLTVTRTDGRSLEYQITIDKYQTDVSIGGIEVRPTDSSVDAWAYVDSSPDIQFGSVLALSPPFSRNIYDYTVTVPSGTQGLHILGRSRSETTAVYLRREVLSGSGGGSYNGPTVSINLNYLVDSRSYQLHQTYRTEDDTGGYYPVYRVRAVTAD